MTIVRTERRQRGIIGILVKRIFVGFNLLMVVWIFGGVYSASHMQASSDAQQVLGVIGTTIGVTLLLILWALGDVILGILVLLTRGNKIITEESSSTFKPRAWSVADEGPAFDFDRVDQRIAELKAERAPSPGG